MSPLHPRIGRFALSRGEGMGTCSASPKLTCRLTCVFLQKSPGALPFLKVVEGSPRLGLRMELARLWE